MCTQIHNLHNLLLILWLSFLGSYTSVPSILHNVCSKYIKQGLKQNCSRIFERGTPQAPTKHYTFSKLTKTGQHLHKSKLSSGRLFLPIPMIVALFILIGSPKYISDNSMYWLFFSHFLESGKPCNNRLKEWLLFLCFFFVSCHLY